MKYLSCQVLPFCHMIFFFSYFSYACFPYMTITFFLPLLDLFWLVHLRFISSNSHHFAMVWFWQHYRLDFTADSFDSNTIKLQPIFALDDCEVKVKCNLKIPEITVFCYLSIAEVNFLFITPVKLNVCLTYFASIWIVEIIFWLP